MTRSRWAPALPAVTAAALALVLVVVSHGGPGGGQGAAPTLTQAAALAPPAAADAAALAGGPRFPATPPECILPLPTEPPPGCRAAADCDDGIWCDGPEECRGGRCVDGELPCPSDGQWCNGAETCDELAQTCGRERAPRCAAEGRVCDEVSDECAVSLDFVAWVTTIVDTLPDRDGERYVVPSRGELLDFEDAVRALLLGDRKRAAESAAMVGYELVALLDSEVGDELLWGLLPAPENRDGRGIFVVRPTRTTIRELVVEAPHPRYDLGTGVTAARLFRDSGARAFAMAGTHRCGNGEAASCGGVTSVCSEGADPHHRTAAAPAERSFFRTFHDVAASLRPETTLVFQIHGVVSQEGAPAFFLSDGRHERDGVAAADLPQRLARAVAARAKARERDRRASRQRAGDPDRPCTAGSVGDNVCVAAPARARPAGSFVHLDLSYDLRPDGGAMDPDVVVDAATEAIPELDVAASPAP